MANLVDRVLRLLGRRPTYDVRRAADGLRANNLDRGGHDDARWWWIQQHSVVEWQRCSGCGALEMVGKLQLGRCKRC